MLETPPFDCTFEQLMYFKLPALDRNSHQLRSLKMPQKIQYMSDLHLERISYNSDLNGKDSEASTISPSASTLILAGDVRNLQRGYSKHLAFLRTQCDQFERVLLVLGNHEFYHASRAEGLEAAERMAQELCQEGKARPTVLNRTRVDLQPPEDGDHAGEEKNEEVVVLGCTLHSHISPDYTRLTNDFEYIRDWTVAQHNAEHNLDVAWLKESLAELKEREPWKKVVIVTHYFPSFTGTCHPDHEMGELGQCFCSNLLEDFGSWEGAEMVKYWIFGHRHWNARFVYRHAKGEVVMMSNQRCCDDGRSLSRWQRWRRWRPFDETAVLDV